MDIFGTTNNLILYQFMLRYIPAFQALKISLKITRFSIYFIFHTSLTDHRVVQKFSSPQCRKDESSIMPYGFGTNYWHFPLLTGVKTAFLQCTKVM